MWVTARTRIVALDPASGRAVGSVPGGRPHTLALAFGPGGPWLVGWANRLLRIGRRAVPRWPPVAGVSDVEFGHGFVWPASPPARALWRLHPETGVVKAPLRLPRGPHAVAVSRRAVWVTNEEKGTVTRVDARSPRAVQISYAERHPSRGPADIATRGDEAWMYEPAFGNRLLRFREHRDVATVAPIEGGRSRRVTQAAAAPSGIYVALGRRGERPSVCRIDVHTGALRFCGATREGALGPSPDVVSPASGCGGPSALGASVARRRAHARQPPPRRPAQRAAIATAAAMATIPTATAMGSVMRRKRA